MDTSDIDGLNPFDLLGAECKRVKAFLESRTGDQWDAPTRCAGWTVRDLVSHFVGVETYHLACLDGRVQDVFAEAAAKGVQGMDDFNEMFIREHGARPVEEVLDDWELKNADVRAQLRDRGPDGSMDSSVGPYPVGFMAFHIASEYATHADDMDVPMTDDERAAQLAWRAKVSLWALKETSKDVAVTREGDEYVVRSGPEELWMSEADFVDAVCARLPDDHEISPVLRDTLRALA